MSLDALLLPIVEALAPTELGAPKTQTVISLHLEQFETLLERGFTYKQIAEGLHRQGARARTGTPFTENSLSSYVKRARDRAAPSAGRRPSVSNTAYDKPAPGGSRNASASPKFDEFRQRIEEARAHAERTKILFGRAKPE